MKKIITIMLGSIVAFTLSMSAAFSAANEVRIAFFLEWATPNQEAKVKKVFDDALGVPVKWTNFATGGEMTEAMLSGDIDISYSQGLTPFVVALAIVIISGVTPNSCDANGDPVLPHPVMTSSKIKSIPCLSQISLNLFK